jgi:hypothetical protein
MCSKATIQRFLFDFLIFFFFCGGGYLLLAGKLVYTVHIPLSLVRVGWGGVSLVIFRPWREVGWIDRWIEKLCGRASAFLHFTISYHSIFVQCYSMILYDTVLYDIIRRYAMLCCGIWNVHPPPRLPA